ncbi:MAG: hypothetical protein RBS78_02890 [Coriobacteriia bacterium]|jgi:hypothetical protein|nr:hypothetical protein [Coriobacteriia bacterium]
MSPGDALIVEHVVVGATAVTAFVRLAPTTPLRSSAIAGLTDALMDLLPGMRAHRCECGSARGVVAELADTELAHVLEHVALELMALSGSPRALGGWTEWDFARDGRGVYRVSLGYDHDLVALAALHEGVALLDALCAAPDAPVDLTAIVDRISAARAA